MRIAWVLILAACDKDRPPTPPVPTAPSSDAAVVVVAPVDDAEVIDAALPLAKHQFLAVEDFSENPYYGLGAITSPGLPAYDGKTLAVHHSDFDGLGTHANAEVWLLDAAGATTKKILVWTQKQSMTFLGDKTDDTNRKREMVFAIDKRITDVEPQLAGFTALEECERVEDTNPMDDEIMSYCDGHETWQCAGTLVTNPRTTKTGRREELRMKNVNGSSKLSTKAWHKPPVTIYSGSEKVGKEETLACIGGAFAIPNTNKILLQVNHACNVSGDWCNAGGPTFKVVTAP